MQPGEAPFLWGLQLSRWGWQVQNGQAGPIPFDQSGKTGRGSVNPKTPDAPAPPRWLIRVPRTHHLSQRLCLLFFIWISIWWGWAELSGNLIQSCLSRPGQTLNPSAVWGVYDAFSVPSTATTVSCRGLRIISTRDHVAKDSLLFYFYGTFFLPGRQRKCFLPACRAFVL